MSSSSSKKKKVIKLLGTCIVCGDKASSMNHYGSKVCFSCRAFFRRLTTKGSLPKRDNCNRLTNVIGACEINVKTRSLCSFCRHQKCNLHGMEPQYVMSKNQIEEMRKNAEQKREEKAIKKRDARLKRAQNIEGKEGHKDLLEEIDLSDIEMMTFTQDDLSNYLLHENKNETNNPELTYLTLDYQFLDNTPNTSQSSNNDDNILLELIESVLN